MDTTYQKVLCPYALRQRDKHWLFCTKMRDAGEKNPQCPHVWRCPGDLLLYNSPYSKECPLIAGKSEKPKEARQPNIVRNVVPDPALDYAVAVPSESDSEKEKSTPRRKAGRYDD